MKNFEIGFEWSRKINPVYSADGVIVERLDIVPNSERAKLLVRLPSGKEVHLNIDPQELAL